MTHDSGLDNDWLIIGPYDREPLGSIAESSLNLSVEQYPICLGLNGCQ